MSEVSKNQLKYENSVSFPNNNSGAITPADLRAFNVDLIDSTVNQTTYNEDSASFYSNIDVLQTEVATLSTNSSGSATTGSNTFVGNQTIEGDLILSNGGLDITISASPLDVALTINNNLNVSGDFTADLPLGYVWLGGGNGRAQAVPSSSIAAGGSTDISQLNAFTASQEILNATFATTGSNVFYGPQTILNGGIDLKANLEGSGSAYGGITTTVDNTTDPTNVYSAYQLIDQSGNNLISIAANSYTSEYPGVTIPYLFGGGNNPGGTNAGIAFPSNGQADYWKKSNFKYGVDVTGSLNVTGTITAHEIHTIIESSSVIFSSGSNILGDSTSDTQTLNGTVKVSGSQQITGSLTQTNGNVTLNGTTIINANTTIGNNSDFNATGQITGYGGLNLYNGGGIGIAANAQGSGSAYSGLTTIVDDITDPTNVYSAIQLVKQGGDAIIAIAANSYTPQYPNTTIPMLFGGGNNPDGNNAGIAFPTNGQMDVWKKSNFKYGVDVTGSLNVTGGITGSIRATNGVISGSAQISGLGYATTGSNTFNGNQTITGSLGVSGITTLKNNLIVSGNVTQTNGNVTLNGTTTINNNTTIGNGSTLGVDGGISTYGGINVYNQYGGITINANPQGSGSQYPGVNLIVSPNAYPTDIFGGFQVLTDQNETMIGMASSTYSSQYFGTNVGSIYGGGNNPDGNNTAIGYPANGEAEHWKKSSFKYGAVVTGSVLGNVNTQTITSNTASFDFSTSNFFELTLVSGSNTRIQATNVKPGQTINVLIKQPSVGYGTTTFSSAFKFAAVAPYTASAAASAKDIVTFVTFNDTGSVYSAAVKNLI